MSDSSPAQSVRTGRATEIDPSERYRLDDLVIDVVRQEVRRGDERLPVNGLSFDLLLTLIRAAPNLVTNDELMKRVWPGLVVSPDTVTQRVKLVRDALGDDARAPRYILGVRGRGYRVAAATALSADVAQGEVVTPSTGAASGTNTRRQLRWPLVAMSLAALTAAVLVVSLLPSQPSVTGYKQLTLTRDWFAPYQSPLALVSDGVNVYFNEWAYEQVHQARKVSVHGGEAIRLAPPFGGEYIAHLESITPDKRELLLSVSPKDDQKPQTFWLWHEGAAPRRLGELGGAHSGWSFDGKWFAYQSEGALYIAHADGSQPRKILSPGPVHWPRFSPDGSRIRFTMPVPGSTTWSLWEVAVDGTGFHQFLEGWNTPSNECCGNWTPDGKTYVFEATHNRVAQIWALQEAASPLDRSLPTPIQLTKGPMNMTRPLIADDGKRIYAVGTHQRADVMRYDPETRDFVPDEIKGRSAEWISYSSDAEWVSYTTFPGADLWRSRRDGTQALQLTRAPIMAKSSAWSPDNKTIAFTAETPGRQGIFLVTADGKGQARQLTQDPGPEWSSTWSPDGASLAFCTQKGIQIFDVRSGAISVLEGSEQMRWAIWSPSGRYLATVTNDDRIPVFDFTTRRWEELPHVDDVWYTRWSPDEQFLYVTTWNRNPGLHHIRLSDRTVKPVVSVASEKWVFGISGPWVGVTPEGDLLYLRDTGVSYIYALDFES